MSDHECEWRLIAETQDRQIEVIRAERDALKAQAIEWSAWANRMTSEMQTKHDARVTELEAERDAISSMVAELEAGLSHFSAMGEKNYWNELNEAKANIRVLRTHIELAKTKHDAHVTKLLETNNREVGRRRKAEQRLLVTGELLTANIGVEAGKALIEGRAAVVPMTITQSMVDELCYETTPADIQPDWTRAINAGRLDKPMENK